MVEAGETATMSYAQAAAGELCRHFNVDEGATHDSTHTERGEEAASEAPTEAPTSELQPGAPSTELFRNAAETELELDAFKVLLSLHFEDNNQDSAAKPEPEPSPPTSTGRRRKEKKVKSESPKEQQQRAPKSDSPQRAATYPGLRQKAITKRQEKPKTWNWTARAAVWRKEVPNSVLFRNAVDKATKLGLAEYGEELKSIEGSMITVKNIGPFVRLLCEEFWRNDTELTGDEVVKRTQHVMRQMELTDERPQSLQGKKDHLTYAFKNALINSGLTYSTYEYLAIGMKKQSSYSIKNKCDFRTYWKSDSWRICNPSKARAESKDNASKATVSSKGRPGASASSSKALGVQGGISKKARITKSQA